MDERADTALDFEEHRTHLRAVAYRMLGSFAEADDALQETWLRVARADTREVENVRGWLTTVVSRVCLNVLRSRKSRREDPIEVHVPDPIVTREGAIEPEQEALLADSVGLAMVTVLDALSPAERLAFVLHDVFAVPFEEIATVVGRSPTATRQLASRARRRVRGAAPVPDPDVARQREVVDAFFAAARGGDLDGLLALLDPEAVLRADGGALAPQISGRSEGAEAIARRAVMFSRPAALHAALVNGAAGVVVEVDGAPFSVMAFTVHDGRIAAIDVLADPDRIAALDLTAFDL